MQPADSKPYAAAILIGRMQLYHNGHAQLLRTALDHADKVVVVLGSAFQARSVKNPFTAEERAAMIAATLKDEERDSVVFTAVRDYYDDAKWDAAVRAAVAPHVAGGDRAALISHQKDASGYYLSHFPEWATLPVKAAWRIDATSLRSAFFSAHDRVVALDALADSVPPAVRHYLKAWSWLGHWARLSRELAALTRYRKSWEPAPYAPIFVTTDAVVRAGEKVLLVRRDSEVGDGLLALPGGFLEPGERLLDGALRELREETQIAEIDSVLRDSLRSVRVWDHPGRSQRGRTITHVHLFVLPPGREPAVAPASDAREVRWVPITELQGLEGQFFEDHFMILDQHLSLLSGEGDEPPTPQVAMQGNLMESPMRMYRAAPKQA